MRASHLHWHSRACDLFGESNQNPRNHTSSGRVDKQRFDKDTGLVVRVLHFRMRTHDSRVAGPVWKASWRAGGRLFKGRWSDVLVVSKTRERSESVR